MDKAQAEEYSVVSVENTSKAVSPAEAIGSQITLQIYQDVLMEKYSQSTGS